MKNKKVLITGITGLVGSVLKEGLKSEFDVTGIDLKDSADVQTLVADSTKLDEITPAFEGVDTVIDLASEPSNFSPWNVIYDNNLRCTYNAFEASSMAGVRRVIFASSNHATGNYENDSPYREIVAGQYEKLIPRSFDLLNTEMAIRPDGPYGIGKAFGEATGRYFSDQRGLSVMCLRIGTLNVESRPTNLRQFATLLTHGDLVRLVKACIKGPDSIRFGIYYGVSNNKWRFWDISNSRKEIGYIPKDNAETWR